MEIVSPAFAVGTGCFREYQRGQTMAEYALILAAVAVVVSVGYQTMGTTITTLLTTVDSSLVEIPFWRFISAGRSVAGIHITC